MPTHDAVPVPAGELEALRNDAARYRTKKRIDRETFKRTAAYRYAPMENKPGALIAWGLSYDLAMDSAAKLQHVEE